MKKKPCQKLQGCWVGGQVGKGQGQKGQGHKGRGQKGQGGWAGEQPKPKGKKVLSIPLNDLTSRYQEIP